MSSPKQASAGYVIASVTVSVATDTVTVRLRLRKRLHTSYYAIL